MLNKIKGCLIGGAIGDALGYPVEFLSDGFIFSKFGEKGITEYQLNKDGVAIFSDDTQMTLFTADGLLTALDRVKVCMDDLLIDYVYQGYLNWLYTQEGDVSYLKDSYQSKLLKYEQLFCQRAPGGTCLSALCSGKIGDLRNPLNNSKGCGGVMRISPIPLFIKGKNEEELQRVAYLCARASAITHGHSLGYIPSAFVGYLIGALLTGEEIYSASQRALDCVRKLFCCESDLDIFEILINRAMIFSYGKGDDLDYIRELGEGWVAEETVAISLYCALRYRNDFEKAIVASVNHSGDSDSTGAVTGNILGAYLGYNKIPNKYLNNLELRDLLVELSTDIFNAKCR